MTPQNPYPAQSAGEQHTHLSTAQAAHAQAQQEKRIAAVLHEMEQHGEHLASWANRLATMLLAVFSTASLLSLSLAAFNTFMAEFAAGRLDIPDALSVLLNLLLVLAMDMAMFYAASVIRAIVSAGGATREILIHIVVMATASLLETATYIYLVVQFDRPTNAWLWAIGIGRGVAAPLFATYLSLARKLPVAPRDIAYYVALLSGQGVVHDVAVYAADRTAPLQRKVSIYTAAATMAAAEYAKFQNIIAAVDPNSNSIAIAIVDAAEAKRKEKEPPTPPPTTTPDEMPPAAPQTEPTPQQPAQPIPLRQPRPDPELTPALAPAARRATAATMTTMATATPRAQTQPRPTSRPEPLTQPRPRTLRRSPGRTSRGGDPSEQGRQGEIGEMGELEERGAVGGESPDRVALRQRREEAARRVLAEQPDITNGKLAQLIAIATKTRISESAARNIRDQLTSERPMPSSRPPLHVVAASPIVSATTSHGSIVDAEVEKDAATDPDIETTEAEIN